MSTSTHRPGTHQSRTRKTQRSTGSRRSAATRTQPSRRASGTGRDDEQPSAAGTGAEGEEGFRGDGRLYYRIGEVSRITGVKPYVLRYWETEFRWMTPPKSRSKQRLYRVKDIETILLIKRLLYEERYTIAGARRRLRELGAARSGSGRSGASEAPEPADPRARLGRVRHELRAIRDLLGRADA